MWPFKKKSSPEPVSATENKGPYDDLIPFQLLEHVRDMLDPYYLLSFSTSSLSVYSTYQNIFRFPDDNLIQMLTCYGLDEQREIEKRVKFPSFRLIGTGTYGYNNEKSYTWEMKLNEYDEFFNNYKIGHYRDFLKQTVRSAGVAISEHPEDAVYNVLLLQNVEPLKNILTTFDLFIEKTGTIDTETLSLFKETLTNFSVEITKRSEALKENKSLSFEEFSAAQKEKLQKEIEYQREIHQLNETNPYLQLEENLKQKPTSS